jgi:hypothetical protein
MVRARSVARARLECQSFTSPRRFGAILSPGVFLFLSYACVNRDSPDLPAHVGAQTWAFAQVRPQVSAARPTAWGHFFVRTKELGRSARDFAPASAPALYKPLQTRHREKYLAPRNPNQAFGLSKEWKSADKDT